ncbi:MAG: mechanosensitive ion channel family protein [Candidatus Omnitrophica bacterium]|nr:mechanosensitive ion channel family protein [Candidatus Omnitrophota bacterium]
MDLDKILITKMMWTVLFLLGIFFMSVLTKSKVKQIQEEKQLAKSRYYTIKRLVSIFSVILAIVLMVALWGINIRHLWVSITSVLAMIAVAFFAVWSLVGNILAGIIIFFTEPFKINDRIEVLPENIKGKVIAINTFFTLIHDEEDNIINIPNSMVFQRFVKRLKRKKH